MFTPVYVSAVPAIFFFSNAFQAIIPRFFFFFFVRAP